MYKRKIKPLEIDDVEIIDYDKTKKAIKAAALGNAIEWFDLVCMAMSLMYWVKSFSPIHHPVYK